jgi:hypothetical protein
MKVCFSASIFVVNITNAPRAKPLKPILNAFKLAHNNENEKN